MPVTALWLTKISLLPSPPAGLEPSGGFPIRAELPAQSRARTLPGLIVPLDPDTFLLTVWDNSETFSARVYDLSPGFVYGKPTL